MLIGINSPLSLANPLVTASISDTGETVLFVLKYFISGIQGSGFKVKNRREALPDLTLNNS
jgi:hypothetical protein